MHTGTQKDDVSLAKEFQERLTKNHRKDGAMINENQKTIHGNKMDSQTVSCSG